MRPVFSRKTFAERLQESFAQKPREPEAAPPPQNPPAAAEMIEVECSFCHRFHTMKKPVLSRSGLSSSVAFTNCSCGNRVSNKVSNLRAMGEYDTVNDRLSARNVGVLASNAARRAAHRAELNAAMSISEPE